MVDIVFGEIDAPAADGDWKAELRKRAVSTRQALNRHRWAIGEMEGRSTHGPSNLHIHNAVLGCLRAAGFSIEMTVHAMSVQDAYIYGFALQERDTGFETSDSAGEAAQRRAQSVGALENYPYLVEITTRLPESGYDNAVQFSWGLDLILEGLDRLLRV
jgi:hypothetical protein